MTRPTTDDTRPDTIRDAFEAMIAFLTILIGGPMPRAWPDIAAVAARAIGSQARTTGEADRAVAALASFRDLIQRAAEEHNRRTSAAAANMPPERLREMRERCERATPGPWAVRDEGREGIGIDQAGINNIGSDRFILNEGANGTRADLDFAAHAREDLPAAIAEIERLTADVATLELKLADAQGEHGRLTAELAARAPADRPEVDAEDLWADYRTGRGTVFASDRKAFLAGVAAGRRTREPDMGAPADASLEARAEDAWYAYLGAPEERRFYPWSSMLNDTRTRWLAVVRAVDASRLAVSKSERTFPRVTLGSVAPGSLVEIASGDLGIVLDGCYGEAPRYVAWVATGRTGTMPANATVSLRATPAELDSLTSADASRPGLTEEQADAIALGCLQVREDLQRHAIKRAILRASRGETFEVRHPDGTRDRVEPPDPRATLHDGNPESPFAPGSLAAGSATEDRILDRKRGGK